MGNNITTSIECENLAPLANLKAEIKSGYLKIAVFANNGSGKTFLSRMFRLLEKPQCQITDETGKVVTDKFISFEKKSCSFSFKVTDTEQIKEDINFKINKGVSPTIPSTYYIYHCFNQDYVDENIQTLSYDKESNIAGYILGKANIDVSNEEIEFEKNIKARDLLKEKIKTEISEFVTEKIGNIPNTSRLNEYKDLSYDEISNGIDNPWTDVSKSYDELISDYNKIKSIPENLSDVLPISAIENKLEFLNEINSTLLKEYSLGSFAEDFKQKIKSKQTFVETGLTLIRENNKCPFCEQLFDNNALNLIDLYNKFIQDEEAKTIRLLNSYKDSISGIIKSAMNTSNDTNKKATEYNNYKSKYIPSLENTELATFTIESLAKQFELLTKEINKKNENISIAIKVDEKILNGIEAEVGSLSTTISDNNKRIQELNSKKNSVNEENKNVRRDLCKVVYNDLVKAHKNNFQALSESEANISKLQNEIKIKKEQQKISKKELVAKTVKDVLKYFFAEKYTLDESTFRLVINRKILDEGQAKEVLSEGEKNVIAFAYYLGDIHLKIKTEDDYNKVFFIIDDPISSMDFNHVYSLSGVIRNLKDIINGKRERYIIFTHNIEFMRVLVGNNIVKKCLILKSSEIKDFNNNLTVPYINHLLDIYEVAKKAVKPTHTTPNSIRHVIETLTKFENIHANDESISKYIQANISDDSKTYTLINDLSHGGWRSEQAPIHEDDMIDVCNTIIDLIDRKYKGQIEYCGTLSC